MVILSIRDLKQKSLLHKTPRANLATKDRFEFINNLLMNIIKSTIQRKIQNHQNENTGISALSKNGILTNNTLDKANILYDQFHKAFTTASDDVPIPNKGPSPYPTMNYINITDNGITKLLQNINPNKATGPDQISGRVLKELCKDVTPAIKLIFQKSISSGKVPMDWKHANVCPVYKKR